MESVCWDVQEQITEYLSSRDLESLAQVSTAYLLYLMNIYFVDQVCWTQAAATQLARRRTRQHGITLVVRSDDSDKNIQWEKYYVCIKIFHIAPPGNCKLMLTSWTNGQQDISEKVSCNTILALQGGAAGDVSAGAAAAAGQLGGGAGPPRPRARRAARAAAVGGGLRARHRRALPRAHRRGHLHGELARGADQPRQNRAPGAALQRRPEVLISL